MKRNPTPPRWWFRALFDSITKGWMIDSGKELDWVVYQQATNEMYHVDPATALRAEYEADLAGSGHRALPLIVARELANAYNHGRHAARTSDDWTAYVAPRAEREGDR